MKTALTRIALLGLVGVVALSGCSSDSPSSNPAPTVVPDTWSITGLSVSDSSPYLGTVVLVTATVTRNGNPAPDGTVVRFESNGYLFGTLTGDLSAGVTEATVTTENGSAELFLLANPDVGAGSYYVQARVDTVVQQVTLVYEERPADGGLQIFQPLLPNEGSYDGGEQVFLNGKGIVAPVEVTFVVQGQSYPAVVENVVESVPASATGTITIRTPFISEANRTQPAAANVVVSVGVTTAPESETLPAAFTFLAEPEFVIYQPFEPRTGTYQGGDLVTITGRAIESPAEVVFTVDGVDYTARVVNVVDSQPATADGQIVIETPFLSAVDPQPDTQWVADVQVTVAADTPGAMTVTAPSAFIFISDGTTVQPTWLPLEQAAFYLAIPDHGPSAGGNTITLLGKGFRAYKVDTDGVTVIETRSAIDEVLFDGQFEAQVTSVSADGTQAEVVVPRFSVTPLDDDEPVSISVTTTNPGNAADTYTETRNDAYVFLADEPQPEIASVSPNAGPLDGGTPVTILGSGFQQPVQVAFGPLTATEVQLFDDQTLADNDEIRCIAPDYSQQGATPPIAVDVTVTNMQTGKSATEGGAFTYGDNLFISGNSPSIGQRGDIVVVFGSGFEDPLRLFLLVQGETELEVLGVSGTEITARIPADLVTCGDLTGEFLVELLESDLEAQGGQFELIGNNPRVLSVDPIFVQEVNDGDGVTPSEVVISGQRFADGAIVEIGPYRVPSSDATIVDATRIDVSNIPSPNAFNLSWTQVSCLTGDGIPGVRRAATPVNVAVINLPGECRDVLTGGIVYEPESPECVVASEIQVVPMPVVFPATAFPDVSAPIIVEISNVGAGELTVQSINKVGAAFEIVSISAPLPVNLSAFETLQVEVEFTPTADDGALYTGTLGIIHTAPNFGNPLNVPLQGREASPVLEVEPLAVDFGTVASGTSLDRQVTIRNSGTDDLNWNASIFSGAPEFVIQGPGLGTVLPGNQTTVTVRFAPTANTGATYDGVLRVDSTDSGVLGAPTDVQLTGDEGAEPDIDTSPFGPGDTWVFPQTAAGGCSAAQNLTISNVGGDDLNLITQTIAIDPPWPAGTFTIAQTAGSPVAPAGSTTLSIEFCPANDDGLTQTGAVTITSNDPDEPSITINLEGPEAP